MYMRYYFCWCTDPYGFLYCSCQACLDHLAWRSPIRRQTLSRYSGTHLPATRQTFPTTSSITYGAATVLPIPWRVCSTSAARQVGRWRLMCVLWSRTRSISSTSGPCTCPNTIVDQRLGKVSILSQLVSLTQWAIMSISKMMAWRCVTNSSQLRI